MQYQKLPCKQMTRICYMCRNKGHIGKNCPLGNNSKPTLFDDHYLVTKAKNICIMANVVNSHNVNAKAILVPKSLMTNIHGPNMVWVPQSS